VIDQIFAGNAMPKIKPFARVYLLGRKHGYHALVPFGLNGRAEAPKQPIYGRE
jgi:hypothetical protein